MFSSKDLISFVFANENDTYYGDDLLKRNLNQYLWERLHENYAAVYFLSAEGNSFRVRSFGDLSCSEYTPGKKKLFGLLGGSAEQTELGGWILRQLRAKPDAPTAFVCALDDFCTVLSDPRWYPVLESIAAETKRTGIFVLTASAMAERSADLLLTSPVFEKLRENVITDLRGGATRDLYSTLKKRKWDNCLFLNAFSWERIHGLLLHLVMENPDRCESCEQLDSMTDYLHTYLRNPEFAASEQLLGQVHQASYRLFTEVFSWLSNERNWNRFKEKSTQFATSGRKYPHWDAAATNVAVVRDPNSYAGKCLKIKLPPWLDADAEAKEQAQSLLQSIQSAVAVPKNKIENRQIVAIAEKLINQLEGVRDTDVDAYCWILNALKFCVTHIYAPQEQVKTDRVLAILQKKQDAITILDHCFMLQRNVLLAKAHAGQGKLLSVTLEQHEAELAALVQLKKRYADLISAMELELEMPMQADCVSHVLEDLNRELTSFEQKLEPVAEEILLPVSNSDDDDYEYIITSDMYGDTPPPH